ncbi:hypothetical protein Sru01_54960 [Sphaerisporangium rufum]|uniref:Histidine kinase/HSP90-like ATPase domain-containing protein n=1 Tax=Sphaerisporangium rufum TaxID=1381558 RepID=A0A919R6G5_9ACTN|nr:ATP-binding protein [Sphaerisporangium rufum]GII80514.1 hypothetical protein Sru01_54960 [Sphaerisporangium rufum]
MADQSTDVRLSAPGHPAAGLRRRLAGRMVWRRDFAGRPDQAREARALVRALLADTGLADDAELVTAELVSNALLHTRSGAPGGHFAVEVIRRPNGVRVGVYDLGGPAGGTGRVPDAEPAGPRSAGYLDTAAAGEPWPREGGRGLAVVAALARRVGWDGDPAGGHLVWAVLPIRQADPIPGTPDHQRPDTPA